MGWTISKNIWKTKQDVEGYAKKHTNKERELNIKSFLMYFGVNALSIYWPDNGRKKTIDDLRQRWNRFKESNTQPVLSTCIWDKNYPDLDISKLNEEIIAPGKEPDCPVINFASKEEEVAMWSNNHPTWVWYNTMKKMILAA